MIKKTDPLKINELSLLKKFKILFNYFGAIMDNRRSEIEAAFVSVVSDDKLRGELLDDEKSKDLLDDLTFYKLAIFHQVMESYFPSPIDNIDETTINQIVKKIQTAMLKKVETINDWLDLYIINSQLIKNQGIIQHNPSATSKSLETIKEIVESWLNIESEKGRHPKEKEINEICLKLRKELPNSELMLFLNRKRLEIIFLGLEKVIELCLSAESEKETHP